MRTLPVIAAFFICAALAPATAAEVGLSTGPAAEADSPRLPRHNGNTESGDGDGFIGKRTPPRDPERRRRRKRFFPYFPHFHHDHDHRRRERQEIVIVPVPTPAEPPEAAPAEPPPPPPDPRGEARFQPARGAAPAEPAYQIGEALPPGLPHVTLDWRHYGLPEPPPGRIYARVGREVLLIEAASRVVERRIEPGDSAAPGN